MSEVRFPRRIAQRILERSARGKRVVVVPRNGKPSRVFDLETYLARQQKTRQMKPWKHRGKKEPLDWLGTHDGRVLSSLRREEIYE